MTLQQLLKALMGPDGGARMAVRLEDAVVPRVDFVDAGANGLEKWLSIQKKKDQRSPEMKDLVFDNATGQWSWVQKSDDTPADAVKLSPAMKSTLASLVAAVRKTADQLDTALGSAQDDESVTIMPATLTAALGELSEVLGKVAPTEKSTAAPAAEPAAEPTGDDKDKDTPAGPMVEITDDGVRIGERMLTGDVGQLAAGMVQKAGDRAQSKEFIKTLENTFGALLTMQAELDPSSAVNSAVEGLAKRMGGEMASLTKLVKEQAATIATQTKLIEGLQSPYGAQVLPLGNAPSVEPSQKGKGAPDEPEAPLVAAGHDLSSIELGEDGTVINSFIPEQAGQ